MVGVLVVPPELLLLSRDASVKRFVSLEDRQRHRAQDRQVLRRVGVVDRASILPHLNVEAPVQRGLHHPVLAHLSHELADRGAMRRHDVMNLSRRLDALQSAADHHQHAANTGQSLGQPGTFEAAMQ